MDIRQLKRFVTISECKSFNKASEILSVSQPSLTRSIQMLEESLDAKLLERGPRGIYLTKMGEELIPYAKIILNERDKAVSSLRHIKSQEGETVTVGAESVFIYQRLPKAIAKTVEKQPNAKFVIREGNLKDMLDLVREGEIDIALGSRANYLDLTDLTFEKLADEGASVVMRAEHPLLRNGLPSHEDLTQAKWIVSDKPEVQLGWSKMFSQWKLSPPPASVFTSSIQLVRNCLLYGDFVSICDYTTCANEIQSGKLVRIEWDAPRFERPSGLFRRSAAKLSPSARTFTEALRAVCSHEAPPAQQT